MKKLLYLLLPLTFLSFFVFANIYLAEGYARLFGSLNFNPFYIFFASLTGFMIGGLIVFTNSKRIIGKIIYIAASVLLGFSLYLIFSLVLADLSQWVLKTGNLETGIGAVTLAFSVSSYSIWKAFQVKTTFLNIPMKGISKPISIMHLSDIHLGHYRGKNFLQKIVDKTNMQKPELVLITGDLFDGKAGIYEEVLSSLKQVMAPVFFVEGNHDGYSGVKKIKSLLREVGVNVLENEVVNWGEIQIIGLNHMVADNLSVNTHGNKIRENIKDVLPTLISDNKKLKILMHHSPDGIKYANENGIDLYLSGHTHAGQLFPFYLITKLVYKYNRGLYQYGKITLYVSQGAGTFGPPMRFGTSSEITLIKVLPKNG